MAAIRRLARASMSLGVIGAKQSLGFRRDYGRCAAMPVKRGSVVECANEAAYMSAMAVVFDQSDKDRRELRHPEKAHRPDNVVLRKPDWIRVKAPVSREYAETRAIVREHNLKTVCEEAACPNIGECWTHRHATMMIMGDTCTRACAFCNVKTGLPGALDDA